MKASSPLLSVLNVRFIDNRFDPSDPLPRMALDPEHGIGGRDCGGKRDGVGKGGGSLGGTIEIYGLQILASRGSGLEITAAGMMTRIDSDCFHSLHDDGYLNIW